LLKVILSLRRQGLSHRSIAERLGISVGRVKYRLRKYARKLMEPARTLRPVNRGRHPLDGILEPATFSTGYRSNSNEVAKVKAALSKNDNHFDPEWSGFTGFQIPDNYHENRLSILPKDPYSIFAYWELTGDTRSIATLHFQRSWEEMSFTARIYDTTGVLHFDGFNASWQEIELHPMANNWYFEHLTPGHYYCVEIGVKDGNGNFLPLIRSNTAVTPRDKAGPLRVKKQQQGWNTSRLPSQEEIEHISSYTWYRN